jgi:uncharacterized protein (TIGR02996 family)
MTDQPGGIIEGGAASRRLVRCAVALTHDAFLSDIVECPDDDAPRLIYADWLDEQGECERAEFVRAQCRLATLPKYSPEWRRLSGRCDELLAARGEEWRAALPALDGVTWEKLNRGFVEEVFAESVEALLSNADALFAAAPVRSVRVGRLSDEDARALARSPHLARLTELNVCHNPALGAEGARALAASPHAGNLTSLLMHYCELGDEAIRLVTRRANLGRLRELYLSGNDLFDESGAYLGEAEGMPLLADLDLRDNQISDGAAQGLAFSAHRQALVTLWVNNNRIGPAGAEALAWTTGMPRLANLYLNDNPIGNDGGVALAESPQREALVELDLRHCEMRDTAGRALAGSPYLHNLQALWVGGNRMRMETLTLLRRRYGDRLRL